jgi:acyl-CoA dehydrogenase
MIAALPPPGAMPDTVGLSFYKADTTLQRVLRRWLDPTMLAWAEAQCEELGLLASTDLEQLVGLADRHQPQLHTVDKRGDRVDSIEFHPAWDRIVDLAYRRFGIAAMSHRSGVLGLKQPAPEVAKQGLFFLFAHSDTSVSTGLSMTDVLARVLRLYAPDLAARYVPRLTATDGTGWQAAMFLTERAGGSDVGVNEATARWEPGGWRLNGHKWFCSNCQADLILTLARPEGAGPGTAGLGLFLVRRTLEDGTRNHYMIHRLKPKLGTRALASGEVTFVDAVAEQVGPLDQGFRQMTEMLNQTRVANAVVSAALIRRSWLEAITHARGRSAFGRRLTDHPLMREVLSALQLESEACVRLAFLAASALQRADAGDRRAALLLRALTPMVKYHTARRAQWATHEAMEVRGGNGYIEDWPNARLVRDAHLLSIWEGTGNIMLLDAARGVRGRGVLEALMDELADQARCLTQPVLGPLRDFLELEAGNLHREYNRCAQLDHETAQLPLRGLVERTVHLLATGLLAADANDDLQYGDGRLALLAARYALIRLVPGSTCPVTDADLTILTTFDRTAAGQPVDPEHASRLLARLPAGAMR